MDCPNCNAPMNQQTFEGNYGEELVLDLCSACAVIWFDDKESLRLSPSSVLALVTEIHQNQSQPRTQLGTGLKCPRCAEVLIETADIQRNTRFNYLRCPNDHGHLITFFQFLREKNIVRSLELKQINELKRRVKVIRCSNCGAPVELEKTSHCSYCQSPISMLDPHSLHRALGELQQKAKEQKNIDPTTASRLIIDKLSVESFYKKMDNEHPSLRGAPSLIETGLGALVDLIKHFT